MVLGQQDSRLSTKHQHEDKSEDSNSWRVRVKPEWESLCSNLEALTIVPSLLVRGYLNPYLHVAPLVEFSHGKLFLFLTVFPSCKVTMICREEWMTRRS